MSEHETAALGLAAADTTVPGTTPEDALAAAISRLPETHPVSFTMKIRGGAYDRLEVDTYMDRLAQAIADVKDAATAVGAEVVALRAGRSASPTANPESEEEITAGAVGLLTQAQLIADKAIADAEQYARDLVVTARNQYREILQRAETSASQATATVAAQSVPALPEIEYVRTYAQVAQIQLRSVLDALTDQVDRLGNLPLPVAEPGVQSEPVDESPIEEPDWEPSRAG